jgi:rhodanese-related sulfurtransferase
VEYKEKGFQSVMVLGGGIEGWKKAGFRLEQG